jgi:hypothetical protein
VDLSKKYLFWVILLLVVAPAVTVIYIHSQHRERLARSIRFQPPASAYLILFGLNDKDPAVWDGRIRISGGSISRIEGWRFAGNDFTDNLSSWKLTTRREGAAANGQLLDNGILVEGSFPDFRAELSVTTLQGDFSFLAQEIVAGESKTYLNGRAQVELVPNSFQVTDSPEEQDFPAASQRNGDDVWVSYVEFTHGDRSKVVNNFQVEPATFDFLARPAGGDQVFLTHYSISKRAWTGPYAVTLMHQDVMRTAVAVDGEGRVWVIWSAAQNGNFDIYARAYQNAAWSAIKRLTSDPGPDLNPVATTDASGRVWVAWQGFRNDNLEILASVQTGDDFSVEKVISFSPASDWDPSIAAAPDGEVAISWDTYDKGDYDVYFRRLHATNQIQLDAPVPVATSDRFEARSSIAYDLDNRLWVTYEGATAKWGKDFGAYAKSGVMLYWGHNITLKCFQGADAFTTATPLTIPGTLNSFPRLTTDSDGKVYLTYRSRIAGTTGAGGIWLSSLYYYEGSTWHGPMTLPHTEGFSDSRPALVSLGGGNLLMLASTDHRLSQPQNSAQSGSWINTDIYASELLLRRAFTTPILTSVAPETASLPDKDVKAELGQVALMRDYRTEVNGQGLRLLRGEFHRHTEHSFDGHSEGPLIDAYRYLLDSAYMDWGGCCDHDNGSGLEYNWWIQQKLTDAYNLGAKYIPMFSYERSVGYPEGHRNVVFARRGIRPLPRMNKSPDDSPPLPAPDTRMLYHYLKQFDGIAASHTSATNMGTDWRDNDPVLEPVVEIYQGDRQNYEMPGAPRSPTETNALGGYRPLGFISDALLKGFRLGFQASSDHISTHISYCNLWVTEPTREGIMEAFHKRRVYGATEDILADVRSGNHFMGEEFEVASPPVITVKLVGMKPFAAVYIIKDNNYVYSLQPNSPTVNFEWMDPSAVRGTTSYYYVRGEQTDGELVWVSPMWITYR